MNDETQNNRVDPSIYPMPMFPTLVVQEFERSEAFYRAAGFIVLARVPGPDGKPIVVHLRRQRYQDLLITLGEPTPGNAQLSFAAHGEDLSALADSLRAATSGVAQVQDPSDTPWFTIDVTCVDPDGYHIAFTSQRAAEQGQASQWADTFDIPSHGDSATST